MKTKSTRGRARQAAALKQIWQDLLAAQGGLRAALPADLERARANLGASYKEARGDESQLQAFHRIGAVLAAQDRPLTMGEISEALRVPLSTATRMIDALVEQGYAERLPDARDRRIVRVALSADGVQVFTLFNEFFFERMYEFLSHFTAAERVQLLELFQKTVTVLQQMSRENAPRG